MFLIIYEWQFFLKKKIEGKKYNIFNGLWGKNLLKLGDDHVNFWKVKNILVINKLQMGEGPWGF